MRLLKSSGEAFAGKRDPRITRLAGEVHLLPDDVEDLWHAYNLIAVGDAVSATTFRKVQKESSTGSVDSQKVKMMIQLEVRTVDFDPEGAELRLSGVTLSEHEGIRLGSHHTHTLEVSRVFRLSKPAWDSLCLERLDEATQEVSAGAELSALLVQQGVATLCLVSPGMSVVKARVETRIPKKGSAAMAAGASKALDKWREAVLQAVLAKLDLPKLKCIVLAGPGFVKDELWAFMCAEAERRQLRDFTLSKPKWVLTHATSGYKHALKEVLADATVSARVADVSAAAEVRVLHDFLAKFASSPDRVTYGFGHVQRACAQGAIERLLLADSLLRVQNVQKRRRYVDLVEAVREAGASVHIFSSLHVSGEQLARLSGIAALLRFPLPLDDDIEDDADALDEADDASVSLGDGGVGPGTTLATERGRSKVQVR